MRAFKDEEIEEMINQMDDSDLENFLKNIFVPVYDEILVSGEGGRVTDNKGNTYIDCTSQAWSLNIGYTPPDIQAAVTSQMKRLLHVRYGFPTIPRIKATNKFVEIIEKSLGEKYRLAYNNMGGSASIEACMRSAMVNKPGAQHFFTCFRGYHGSSLATMTATFRMYPDIARFRPWGLDRITHVPFPYCYRCPMGKEGREHCHLECLDLIAQTIEYGAVDKVAGFLLEPMQGPGGHIPAPEGFLEGLRKVCDQNDIYLIYDESQTFTRIGSWFAAEYYKVNPDFIAITKSLAGGLPMGAMLARDKADLKGFNAAEEHSTFSSNPLMFAGHIVYLSYVEKMNILQNARELGEYITGGLQKLQQKYEYMGDIRCPGLFIGVELVEDRETKKPGNTLLTDTVEAAKEEGVIFGESAPIASGRDDGILYRNVLKIKPPLIITKEDCDLILKAFEKGLIEAIDYL
ncbi:MAG: aspartate aminotransferase family protein [Candidatus Odinarchaeota archaeon]